MTGEDKERAESPEPESMVDALLRATMVMGVFTGQARAVCEAHGFPGEASLGCIFGLLTAASLRHPEWAAGWAQVLASGDPAEHVAKAAAIDELVRALPVRVPQPEPGYRAGEALP